jgi:tetratricopeptide (TPR) repeat protein
MLTFAALLALTDPAELAAQPTTAGPSRTDEIALVADEESLALYEAGVAAFEQENFERALAAFDASLRLEVSAQTLYGRAQTYYHLGRCEEAVADYQRVIELLPEHHPAQHTARDAVLDCATRMKDPTQAKAESPAPRFLVLQEPKPIATGKDPGRHLRRGGTAALVLAPLPILVGVGLGAHFLKELAFFNHRLRVDKPIYQRECVDMDPSTASIDCDRYKTSIDDRTRYAAERRWKAGVSLGVGLGLGAGAIAAGILMRREGKRRSERWRNGMARVQLLPTPQGMVLTGRF